MSKIKQVYCGSLKQAAIFLATLQLFFFILNLVFMDFSETSYLLHSDLEDDLGRSVVFYSLVVGSILSIFAALSFLYGLIKERPQFMIPILIKLPICLVLKFIYCVTWFAWIALIRFIISMLLTPYAWFCFYVNWQYLRQKNKSVAVA